MTGKRTCKQALNGFVHGAKQYKMKICYNKASYAKAGSGPCGTWCTLDVKVGGGCGNNKMRLCKFKGGKKPAKKVVKKKLSNPCAKNNGAFKFVARMHKSKICYNKAAYAKSGSGPCGSWCTLDVKVGSGCGNNKLRLCKIAGKKSAKKVLKKIVKVSKKIKILKKKIAAAK